MKGIYTFFEKKSKKKSYGEITTNAHTHVIAEKSALIPTFNVPFDDQIAAKNKEIRPTAIT
jgi:hypothetical protein